MLMFQHEAYRCVFIFIAEYPIHCTRNMEYIFVIASTKRTYLHFFFVVLYVIHLGRPFLIYAEISTWGMYMRSHVCRGIWRKNQWVGVLLTITSRHFAQINGSFSCHWCQHMLEGLNKTFPIEKATSLQYTACTMNNRFLTLVNIPRYVHCICHVLSFGFTPVYPLLTEAKLTFTTFQTEGSASLINLYNPNQVINIVCITN